MKKSILLSLVAVFAVTFALVGCGGGSKSDTIVWKLASNQAKEHPQLVAMQELSDKFYKETNGAYRIEISPKELLGTQKDAFELLQSNIIQMVVVANTVLEVINDDFAVLALPGVYDSIEHQKAVYTSDTILKDLFSSITKNHVLVLSAYTAAARNIYTDKPVRTPADLKGYKIRVMESRLMMDTIKAMGGIPTPLSTYEAYTAIQSGIINGAENNEISYVDFKHYELVKFYSYTKHLMVPDELVINTEAYASLSPEHKAIFDRLLKEAVIREFELFAQQTQKAKETAAKAGVTFVDDVDVAAFQKNFAPIVNELTSKSASKKNLYNSIRNAR